MKPNRVRGSAFDEFFAKEASSLNIMDNLLDDLTGFRLAFDSSTRDIRGGPWAFTGSATRAVSRFQTNPGNSYDSLGFRLVREGT